MWAMLLHNVINTDNLKVLYFYLLLILQQLLKLHAT